MFKFKRIKKLLIFGSLFLVFVAFLLGPFSLVSQSYAQPTAGKLAVTPAGYDNMGDVLKKLGFTAEEIQESDLTNLANLQKYDAIYINCSGGIDSHAKDAATALRDYVKNGGVVYASDYANSLIQAAFPGKINFYKGTLLGGLGETDTAQSSRVGVPGKVEAKVVDPGLATVLGKSTVEVNYDLGAWVVVESAGSGSRVHMSGPVKIMDFSGVDPNTFQDFGNIDWTNPNAVEEFNKKWADTGKSIGDKPYVISFSEGKGEVLYTTFHNEAQVTTDVKNVLNWFGIRTKGSKLASQTRALTESGENIVLQEIVDGINKDENKNYSFNASGLANFSVTLNFGGSALSLTVTDPDGKNIIKEKVEKPPLTKSVKAIKGQYKIEVKGIDVSEQNMPLVLVVSGPKKAISEETTAIDQTKTEPEKTGLEKFITLPVVLGFGALGLVLLTIGLVLMIARRNIKSVLSWILIVLGVIFIVGAILSWFYFIKEKPGKITETPSSQTSQPETTTPTETKSTETTTTETKESKTVKDVHCLQKPTQGDQITIENLTDYQSAKSPLVFSGKANAFENQFSFRLKDCRGPIITEGTIMAEGEMGTMPPYSKTITFELSRSPLDAILEVYELSAADGSEVSLYQVPLRLNR